MTDETTVILTKWGMMDNPVQTRRIAELEQQLSILREDRAHRERIHHGVRKERDELIASQKEIFQILISGTVFEDGEPSYYNGDIGELFRAFTQ